MTIREMGLQDSINTRIGGWGAKGLSGGQKRRLSICIEILTLPKLLFMDEPTSGLDSAASYFVMSRIVRLADRRDGIGRTIIVSIHQPSTEVFHLFHNLCLLCAGRTVYFGPVSATNDFFASNGFPCPSLQNPSDHFLKTINKDFDKDIEHGFANSIPTEEVIKILVQSYKSSDIYKQVQNEVAQISKQDGGEMEEKTHATFFTQCNVLTRRSFINMYRDIGYYWMRLVVYIAIAVALATMFTNIGMSYGSIQARGALILFISAFLTFMAIGGFPSFVEEMKVFERERLNGHYGDIAFVLANTVSALPFLVVISVIPGVIAYYIPGLQKGSDHFLFFVATLFACMILVESLMMVIASLVPNFLMGIIIGAGIQGLLVLVAGFFRLPTDLPKPIWRYPLHHIAFHKYAYQGLLKNEFEGLTFPNIQAGGPPTLTGEQILKNIWHVEMGYSKWVDLAILFAMVVACRFVFLCIIKSTEKVKPMIAKFKSAIFQKKKKMVA
ncbi:ABC transporter-like protein [Corchorus olitorius]|uniref:ABC transporter-like protein n=1 Tax=Corchorus olitorius TaxID=93759 RepID=A0A1R3GZR1_9ROSI|nr:ABC transporter-like protein [Corchorus olitorius]